MMDTSSSTALPVMFFCVLLLSLPSASTTSTRPPRSCHLAVAEDRLALPAQSSSLPVVLWTGSVDRVTSAPACSLSYPVQVFGNLNSPYIRRVWRSFTPEVRTAGKCRKESFNDKPRPSPPEGDMRHQATVSGPPAASSRRLLVRFRDWSKREAAGTRSENARGSTRRARASSDRREHGQLLPTAQATPPRLPLLFSWARGRLPCVCVPTCPTLAKCALKALGAFFAESVHARFLGCYVVVTNPSPSRCCATMARAVAADSSAR